MRTNIFLTANFSAKGALGNVENIDSGEIGIIKPDNNNPNLYQLCIRLLDNRDMLKMPARTIPIHICNIKITESLQALADYNKDYIKIKPQGSEPDDLDYSDYIGRELGIRLSIPADLNHRNSWCFTDVFKNGDTFSSFQSRVIKQIVNSSMSSEFKIVHNADNSVFIYLNEPHNTVILQHLDDTPTSWFKLDYINMSSFDGVVKRDIRLVTREYVRKLIIDADANYGFDYLNCFDKDFYPNQLSANDVDKLLSTITNTKEDGNIRFWGLTHIEFTEPRVIETTGDVVRQVINIIHPTEDTGSFVIKDYASMIAILDNDFKIPYTE